MKCMAIQYRNWTLLWSDELNAAFQHVSFVFLFSHIVLGQQVVQPGEILLCVEVVHQLAYTHQSHQLRNDEQHKTLP